MKKDISEAISKALKILGIDAEKVNVEFTGDLSNGDYSSNIAFIAAKTAMTNPKDLAEKIVAELKKYIPEGVAEIKVAGAGFLNFYLTNNCIAQSVVRSADGEISGGDTIQGKKIMVEYTDPNPFKVFHIGHLMSNAIGESISRLLEYSEAHIIRTNWQGDVGPHVAKAIWGAMRLQSDGENENAKNPEEFWGKAYVKGAEAYDSNEESKKEINEINKKIYSREDEKINELYDKGRKESLDAFEIVYERLGTEFDNYFFEGKEGRNGEAIARGLLQKGILEKSDGAIIFPGEKYGLHTRVFINSQGLPTYETKELGLNVEKFKLYPDLDQSIIVTANEQSDYFKVLLKVFDLFDKNISAKTKHISHGMMRFAHGKMSSRKGNVISGTGLIDEVKELVIEKMGQESSGDSRQSLSKGDQQSDDQVADMVAIGAIKYTILRQAIGGDIIFDSVKSISFEGDSGPYLQYSAVRAGAVLKKAKDEGIDPEHDLSKISFPENWEAHDIERLLVRFGEVANNACREFAPQYVANYLMALAGEYNSFYAKQKIVDKADPLSPYYVTITEAFRNVIVKGLWLLGIGVPERM